MNVKISRGINRLLKLDYKKKKKNRYIVLYRYAAKI